MARKKLERFGELDSFDNVAQVNQLEAKEKLQKFLGPKPKIILELACGKGEYSLALAKEYTDYQIVGIDIQGERLWYGAKKSQLGEIKNVFFLRIQIEDLLKYFKKSSVSQIWITFPDPYPKKKQTKKRLTSPRFLKIYKKILKNKAPLHLKTDDMDFFNYSIDNLKKEGGQIIKKIEDVYQQEKIEKILKIQTSFEKKHLKAKHKINYLKFTL